MDFAAKWSNLPEGPSLKNLTDGRFGALKECQHGAIQDLTRAHIDSFDQAVTDGLGRVVQVWPALPTFLKRRGTSSKTLYCGGLSGSLHTKPFFSLAFLLLTRKVNL